MLLLGRVLVVGVAGPGRRGLVVRRGGGPIGASAAAGPRVLPHGGGARRGRLLLAHESLIAGAPICSSSSRPLPRRVRACARWTRANFLVALLVPCALARAAGPGPIDRRTLVQQQRRRQQREPSRVRQRRGQSTSVDARWRCGAVRGEGRRKDAVAPHAGAMHLCVCVCMYATLSLFLSLSSCESERASQERNDEMRYPRLSAVG